MEVVGKIKLVGNTQEVNASFKKRELLVVTDEQYPQSILIEFAQEKCDLLNSYKVGQEVKVSINLRGREWTNPQGEVKYFNQIQGWRIEKQAEPQAPKKPDPIPAVVFQTVANVKEVEHDDLPF